MQKHIFKSLLLFSTLVLALLITSCGEDKAGESTADGILLKFNFQPGETYAYDMETVTSMNQEMMGQKIEMENTMMMKSIFEASKGDGNNTLLKVTYDRMAMDMKSNMMNMHYDSDDSANSTPELAAMGGIVKKPFTMTVSPTGEIIAVSGLEEIVKSSAGNDPAAAAQMKQMMNDSMLRNMMSQSFNIYPKERVKVGDTWKKEMKMKMGFADMNMLNDYKLVGVKDGIANLEVVSKLTMAGGGQLPQGATMNITGNSKGTMDIVIETGMVKASKLDMVMDGAMEMQGMKIPMKMNSKVTIAGSKR